MNKSDAATNNNNNNKQVVEPEREKCPRCDSTNTKFCYYNNYNKSQPRHFCKSCKRHWTVGGILRAVPIGGARKSNKRCLKTVAPSTSSTTTSTNVVVVSTADKDQFPHDHDLLFPKMITPIESSPSPSPSSFDSFWEWDCSWSLCLDVLSSTTTTTDAAFSVPWDDNVDHFDFFKP